MGEQHSAEKDRGVNPIIRYAEMADGPEFDEFIADNARVHFERMGEAQFWLMVTVDGRDWHINCGAQSTRAKGYAICEEDALPPSVIASDVPTPSDGGES